jgi:hypothetical protein
VVSAMDPHGLILDPLDRDTKEIRLAVTISTEPSRLLQSYADAINICFLRLSQSLYIQYVT